jgi:hypothetical protein
VACLALAAACAGAPTGGNDAGTGCCSPTGCRSGLEDGACGAGGQACVQCGSTEICQLGACRTRPTPRAPGEARRMFVTEAGFNGDLKSAGGGVSGLDGADRICGNAAAAAGLGGAWKAFLSDSSAMAIDRVADVGPWFLVVPAGMTAPKVFNDKAGLAGAALEPITRTESGQPRVSIGGSGSVWTGNGPADRETCADWTRYTGDGGALGGSTGDYQDAMHWSVRGGTSCASKLPLYCLEQ